MEKHGTRKSRSFISLILIIVDALLTVPKSAAVPAPMAAPTAPTTGALVVVVVVVVVLLGNRLGQRRAPMVPMAIPTGKAATSSCRVSLTSLVTFRSRWVPGVSSLFSSSSEKCFFVLILCWPNYLCMEGSVTEGCPGACRTHDRNNIRCRIVVMDEKQICTVTVVVVTN